MSTVHFEISETDQALFSSLSQGDAGKFIAEPLSIDNISEAADAEIITVFINSQVTADVIDRLPNLKLIVTRSTGFDHIDTSHAKSKGIAVCNVPAYGSRTVAEFAFALMLGLSRKVVEASMQVEQQNNWDVNSFEGFNLQGKTLGIVGTGRIGLNAAQIAKGFDMTILAFDAFPNQDKATQYGFTYAATLDEVLSQSDVVTLHVPALPETKHMINKANISKFKKGALLINTARGDVVDPEALLQGLNDGTLGGAGLDVLAGEQDLKEEAELMASNKLNLEQMRTLLEDHMLLNHPKVLVTPHIAFNTTESRQEIIDTTLKNIASFGSGQQQNVVNS